MTYHDILHWLQNQPQPVQIPTLGGRSSFSARSEGGQLLITNAAGGEYPVDAALYDASVQRHADLPANRRTVGAAYTDPEWADCPNRIVPPYVVALYRHAL